MEGLRDLARKAVAFYGDNPLPPLDEMKLRALAEQLNIRYEALRNIFMAEWERGSAGLAGHKGQGGRRRRSDSGAEDASGRVGGVEVDRRVELPPPTGRERERERERERGVEEGVGNRGHGYGHGGQGGGNQPRQYRGSHSSGGGGRSKYIQVAVGRP